MKLSRLFYNPCNVHFVRSRMKMPRIEIAQKFIDSLIKEGKIIEAYTGYYRIRRDFETVTVTDAPQHSSNSHWRRSNSLRDGITTVQAAQIELRGHTDPQENDVISLSETINLQLMLPSAL